MAKYYALIREVDETEDLGVKYDCEVVGWKHASGRGGNTIEEAIASAIESIKSRAEEGEVEYPNIKVVEFEVDV